MSRTSRLIQSYTSYIGIPWRSDAAAAQRVIFCVYDQSDELRIRCRIDEFELATKQAGHEWVAFNLTNTFADWLSGQRYAKSYFANPTLLQTLLPKYLIFIRTEFESLMNSRAVGSNSVVALKGVGTLFGLLKVKEVVEALAPLVPGRLLVFFPGAYEDNNYRLLDGYDGWNYLAVPITGERNF